MNKKCSRCDTEKPASEFHRNSRTRDGLHSYCKECNRARARDWVANNRERHNSRRRDTCYGMPIGWHLEQQQVQGNSCAICGSETKLYVDHDHKCCPHEYGTCGECTRALLCNDCNRGLGNFKDDPELLRAAVAYLDKYNQ